MKLTFQTLILSLLCQAAIAQSDTLVPRFVSYIDNTTVYARDVKVDCAGNIIYVGGTKSAAFVCSPNTISTGYNGGNCDVFIVKIDSSGHELWRTLIGGNKYDRAYAVETDDEGFIYVAGRASSNFPTTQCALQENFAGDINTNGAYGAQDGFICKVSPYGQLIWSTYVGGEGRGFIRDMALDSEGNVWAGMSTVANTFPHITANAAQPTATAGFNTAIVKVSADGSTLLYGSFLTASDDTGIGPPAIRVDHQDNAILLSMSGGDDVPVTPGVFQPLWAGNSDFVVSKFSSDGTLIFSSYLGGSTHEEIETHSLEVTSNGDIVVAAYSNSTDYPTTPNAVQPVFGGGNLDGVLSLVSADGSTLLASTFIGGSGKDELEGVGIDSHDNIYVTGNTTSQDFPVSPDAYQKVRAGTEDGLLTMVSADLSKILYSTLIGGGATDRLRSCDVDNWDRVHAAGYTTSDNLPVLNPFDPALTNNVSAMVIAFDPEVIIQSAFPCSISTDTVFSQAQGTPACDFSFSVLDSTVAFTGLSYGGALEYHWDFGDGSMGTERDPVHIYSTPATFQVCLITSNACGADTLCQEVVIEGMVSGISDLEQRIIKVYPNPAVDQLVIEYEAAGSGDLRFCLYDLLGAKVLERKLDGDLGKAVLDVSGLAAGAYVFRVIGEDGVIGLGKVLVE
ncbi:MAG: SBBP repeat-containing protein [Lewinellaceae bacterium]|nr:SBBP repeat-containing protein [Lewinellaceae bacterium]